MKRRSTAANLEGKWRRPLKRAPKMTDNFYTSSLVYIKLLVLWGLVLTADYFLDFRFEYLWPFWLFIRSVYDSFKYQGLAFSVFFICIAVTSDMICYLFIPVHWLFFAASTYVWVQYVWHTEKGICLPTVALWLLFVYIEASIRLKEIKAHIDVKSFPFNLDLCRPFASHCIGYPVVTLGFGFKSYIGYRFRIRRQKEIQKSNEYYFEFLREALPPGQARDDAFNPHPSPKTPPEDRLADGAPTPSVIAAGLSSSSNHKDNGGPPSSSSSLPLPVNGSCFENGDAVNSAPLSNGLHNSPLQPHNRRNGNVKINGDDGDHDDHDDPPAPPVSNNNSSNDRGRGGKGAKNNSTPAVSSKKNREDLSKLSKDELLARKEQEIKKHKVELQLSRNKENELREQIISYMSSERMLGSEISTLQVEKSLLEVRISGLNSTRATEKASLSTLEKKLMDERKQKSDFQFKLEMERKSKKEAANAERTAQQNQTRSEVLKLEAEIKTLRSELNASRERCHNAEEDLFVLRKYKETHGDPEVLLNALKQMQKKNEQIEKSLSEETKVKLDLFSALGETKRELGHQQNKLSQKDHEIAVLKAKIAEAYACMPGTGGSDNSVDAIVSSSASMGNNNGATGNSLFSAPSTTLALDLPHCTDLSSFTGGAKMSALGLSDLDGKLFAPGEYQQQSGGASRYSPKANGKVE